MATVAYAHIGFNPDGVPIVSGTSTKVVELIADHLIWGWDAQQIQRQYPYLSLGQIHSALSYYYDHQREIDADMQRREKLAAEMKAQFGPGPASDKLKATGRTP
ncbi:MAG: DUF433 domain-containing protein [Thermoguttaceae bacterium]|jgi:uncharacterized protein (DUF433 family)